jgi:hypothetical protein
MSLPLLQNADCRLRTVQGGELGRRVLLGRDRPVAGYDAVSLLVLAEEPGRQVIAAAMTLTTILIDGEPHRWSHPF